MTRAEALLTAATLAALAYGLAHWVITGTVSIVLVGAGSLTAALVAVHVMSALLRVVFGRFTADTDGWVE